MENINTNAILTSLINPSQIPLNRKEYCIDELTLKSLGQNNYLAYTYHKGLEVTCVKERTKWEWKEMEVGDTGLLLTNFTYPNGIIVDGVDYSNKTYNFVRIETSAISVVDATNIIKGILKLTNDLGGTADNPTTPTALHKTLSEAFTGFKSAANTAGTPSGIIIVNESDANTSGFQVYNESTTTGADIWTNGSGDALWIRTHGSGTALTIVSSQFGGKPFSYINNTGGETTWIDKSGDFHAPKLIKVGGTALQVLMADGTIRRINPQKDTIVVSNYTITDIDNGTTIFVDTTSSAITISLGAITLPEFCVGFIHKAGVNNITYTGVTNPIGLKSLGAGYQTFIERELNTGNYYLLGNTKA